MLDQVPLSLAVLDSCLSLARQLRAAGDNPRLALRPLPLSWAVQQPASRQWQQSQRLARQGLAAQIASGSDVLLAGVYEYGRTR